MGEDGELRFLMLCLYKLAGHRSLQRADVIHVAHGHHHLWVALEGNPWRVITAPAAVDGEPLNASSVTAFAHEIASLRQHAAAIAQRAATGRKFSLRRRSSR
jgi:hypothetical protein